MRKPFFLFLSLFLIVSINTGSYAAIKNPFKKSKAATGEEQKEKMPETEQEWEIQAQNVPLEERKLESYQEPLSNDKIIYGRANYAFELYNDPPGSRELSIDDIKKNLYSYPYIVSDNKCHYAAYSRYYYSPDINQISSEFFVEKLDTTKTKVRRMLDYNHNQKTRKPVLISGKKDYYPNLFSGLTLVDWSKDGKRLLIKEKIGSTLKGIYKTNLYIHFMGNEITNGYTVKLENVDNIIKKYFLNYRNLEIIKYGYDLEPLGFSLDNDDIIVILAYVYDKNNEKIFLGTWGYNISSNEIILFSKVNKEVFISANGLVLVKTLD